MTNSTSKHPHEDRLRIRAGYFGGDMLFDIGGLPSNSDSIPKFIPAVFSVLTAGVPTKPSKRLLDHLEINWEELRGKPQYLLSSENLLWKDTIKGGDLINPALDFFETILPKELGDLKFICNLLIPEYPLFDELKATERDIPINSRRVDFYLPHVSAVIEIDGGQHSDPAAKAIDRARDRFCRKHGITTYRISTESLKTRDHNFKTTIEQLKNLIRANEITDCYKSISQTPKYEGLLLDQLTLTACIRLQISLLSMVNSGLLDLTSGQWHLHIQTDVKELSDTHWIEAAIDDLFDWLKIYSNVFGEQLQQPSLKLSPSGQKISCSLLKRSSELELQISGVTVNTSAVQELPDAIKQRKALDPLPPILTKFSNYFPEQPPQGALERLLEKVFGHSKFRDGQLPIIRNVFDESNCLGLLPTGGGKSLTFQLPNLLKNGLTIVVVPIVALGRDHKIELERTGFEGRVEIIDSTVDTIKRRDILRRMKSGVLRFLFVSPERFQSKEFASAVESLNRQHLLNYFVVDEVHCLSEWGHEFRPAYLALPRLFEALAPKIPIVCLTATAAVNTVKDIKLAFDISDEMISYEMHRGRSELKFEIDETTGDFEKVRTFVAERISTLSATSTTAPPGLVFTTRLDGERGALTIFQKILDEFPDLRVGLFTGGAPKDWKPIFGATGFRDESGVITAKWDAYKLEVQRRWKAADLDLVVATKAFGMGVNKANVRYTLHAQMPGSLEAFYQEAGRAGRDGYEANCKLLYKPDVGLSQRELKSIIAYPAPAKLQNFIRSSGFETQGDVRSQFYFLNRQNFETKDDVRLMMQLLSSLPNGDEEKIISRKENATLAKSGYHLQIALYRLHQLGAINFWTVLDWGFEDNGVESVTVKCKSRSIPTAIKSYQSLVESIDGTNSERYQQSIALEEALKYEPTEIDAWELLSTAICDWIKQSHVSARVQSTINLYNACLAFNPDEAEQFRQRLEDFFKVDTESNTLADLKDLSFENAAEKITEIISGRSGKLKSRSVLSKLSAQTLRLLEGATQNQSLLLAAGILALLDESDKSFAWSETMTQLGLEESEFMLNDTVWKLMYIACSKSTTAKMRFEDYLCSTSPSLAALNRYNASFTSTRVAEKIFVQFSTELKKVI